jgi:hypothetical protein
MSDLFWWLQHFKHSAFRLETRPVYTVPQEVELLERFRNGEEVSLGPDHPWVVRVKAATAAGKTMQRVRVISNPLTEYERLELSLYPYSIDAGEDIRIMVGGAVDHTGFPDFWLFDDQVAIILHYSIDGRFLEALEQADSDSFRSMRDESIRHSMRLVEYTQRTARL